jgi:menaquinone-dependent protoporphyrinogen oxidase
MSVLVAYATMNGSTAEIAEWIGDELRATGVTAEVRRAADVPGIAGYEAVILGGSIYMSGWHVEARQFIHRFRADLTQRPVWLFSSGPLDLSAEETELPPVPQVASALDACQALGHITFGGRINEESHGWLGYVAQRMAQSGEGGDFRNPRRVRAWAREIASALQREGSRLDNAQR